MELKKMTVEGFVQETSSSSPAPGGGSIAALNAASAAALIEMVAHLTLGKEKYAAVEKEMKEVAEKAASLKNQFLALIDEDSNASIRSWQPSGCLKGRTRKRLFAAKPSKKPLRALLWFLLKLVKRRNELFALADVVITRGNTNAVTDGAVAAMNTRAAVRGAFLNVKINLGSIKDQTFVDDLNGKMAAIEKEVDGKEQALLGKVNL